ncbi:MAG TPA: hypothetical protein VF337_06265 [Candidatus Limnocylindrales bacterium]
MFWMHDGRAERRKKVLDELLLLDPAQRRRHLDDAVTAGDVRESEVESALLLVHRLDVLRVMTVPSDGRLPGGILPVVEFHLRTAETAEVADEPAPVIEAERRVARALVAGRSRSGAHSSRQRRLRAAAGLSPAGVAVEVGAIGS